MLIAAPGTMSRVGGYLHVSDIYKEESIEIRVFNTFFDNRPLST